MYRILSLPVSSFSTMDESLVKKLGSQAVNFEGVLSQLEQGRKALEDGDVFESDWDYLGINRSAAAVAEYLRSLEDTTLNAVAALLNDPDEEIQVILRKTIQYEQERGRALPALAHHISDVTAEEQAEEGIVRQIQRDQIVRNIKAAFFSKVT